VHIDRDIAAKVMREDCTVAALCIFSILHSCIKSPTAQAQISQMLVADSPSQ
jgi:hypothetical protein